MTGDDQPWVALLGIESIERLHAEGMRRYSSSGAVDPPTPGCVEGAVGNAWTAEAYQEERRYFKAGIVFASYLLFYLAKDHCFVDGNKRVAWLAMTAVLLKLGLTIETSTDDAETLVTGIVEGTVGSGADVAAWLVPRLAAVAPII